MMKELFCKWGVYLFYVCAGVVYLFLGVLWFYVLPVVFYRNLMFGDYLTSSLVAVMWSAIYSTVYLIVCSDCDCKEERQ